LSIIDAMTSHKNSKILEVMREFTSNANSLDSYEWLRSICQDFLMNKKFHTNFNVWVELAKDLSSDLPSTKDNAEPFTTSQGTRLEPVD
jgi:hypothetical protein